MKAAALQELLESVRENGAYLKGNRNAVCHIDRIWSQSAPIRAKVKLSQGQ
ncbi:MAG: hypothetical protein ABI273_01420 [Lacunisphaera sp.]